MTHDELLAKVTNFEVYLDGEIDAFTPYAALRAVVELHKPETINDFLYCPVCSGEDFRNAPYPCETIQAIEKELG